jgi:hypothetical protein
MYIVKLIAEAVLEKAKKIQEGRVEVVYLSVKDKRLFLESKAVSTSFELTNDCFYRARLALGQNALMTYGPVSLSNNPVIYVLTLKPSILRMGLRNIYRQLKDWKGQSCFGSIPVILYKTFWSF